MLELKRIHYHPATSDEPILTGVSLKSYLGKLTIVSGASGSGKTSLIEIISGLSKPQEGKIKWFDSHLNESQRRSLCGVVFQFPERHFLGLTVGQELRLGHRRLDHMEQFSILKKVGLEGVDIKQAPELLSGGQQRRLAIAVQLLRRPKILLLDEPTAGLDWSVRNEIIELLIKLAKKQLIFIVTHEPELFHKLNTCSYQLQEGKLNHLEK